MKIAVLLVLITSLALPHSANVKLEYNFIVGDQYTMTQLTQQTVTQSVMGMEQQGENMFRSVMSFRVVSLTETGAKLEAQFLSLKNRSQSILGEIIMDSEAGDDNNRNKAFKAIIRKPFIVILDSNGEVRDVEQSENLWSGINSLNLDPEEEKKLKESLGQWFNKNALISNVEQAMVYYDAGKVSPGDTWFSKSAFPMDFPILIDNTWSLLTLKGSTAVVKANGIYATTNKDKVLTLPNGMKTKVDLKGKQQLESNINTKTGWPTDLRIVAELTGKMTLLAGGFLPQDMEMPTKIVAETTYTYAKSAR